MDYLWSVREWLRWLVLGTQYIEVGTRYWLGFLVALGCFLLVTLFFVKDVSGKGGNPRLFTVLALFAATWALTASIYEVPPYPGMPSKPANTSFRLHDVAADLASFLMVFVGALLAREGRETSGFFNSQRLQVYALVLLGLLTVPTQAAPRLGISPAQGEQTELLVAGALGLLGFISLGVGGKAVAKPEHYRWLYWTLVGYGLLVIGRHAHLIVMIPKREPMSDFFVIAFAMVKVLLTLIFCTIVVRHHDKK
jgi:hypothetical protein